MLIKYIIKVNGNPIQSFWKYAAGVMKKLELRKLNPGIKVTMLELKISAEDAFKHGGLLPRLDANSQNNLVVAEKRIKNLKKAQAEEDIEIADHMNLD